MAAVGGVALKVVQTFIYVLAFCCASIILALYSYFLASLANHDAPISNKDRAIEGISGIAVFYTICAAILTCCLGGMAFFAFLGIFLDILFVAGFIGLAIMLKHGASACTGTVNTPLGYGPGASHSGLGTKHGDYGISLRTACRFNEVCFAVAVIGALLFIFATLFQLWLARHHQREKRFGPSPKNNYTSGSGNRWFRRRRGGHNVTKDAELGAVAAGGVAAAHHHHNKHEHVAPVAAEPEYDGTYAGTKYDNNPTQVPTAGGFHTGPTGTSVNPYGYEHGNTNTTAATNY